MTRRSASTAALRLVDSGRAVGSDLVRLLEELGDEASRAVGLKDVRMHIVSCQAHHLAVMIAERVGWPSPDGHREQGRRGVDELAREVSALVPRMRRGEVDVSSVGEIETLVVLAQAVAR